MRGIDSVATGEPTEGDLTATVFAGVAATASVAINATSVVTTRLWSTFSHWTPPFWLVSRKVSAS
jgi:hypothetical protein